MPISSAVSERKPASESAPDERQLRVFYPEEPFGVWLIVEGRVDLFLQKMVNGEYGARHYIVTLAAGSALFGMDMQSHGGLTLVAASHPGTQVRRFSRAVFLRRHTLHPTLAPYAALESWIEALYTACTLAPPPNSSIEVRPGEHVTTADRSKAVCAAEGVVYVRKGAGEGLLFGRLPLSSGDTVLPLSRRSHGWIELLPGSVIDTLYVEDLRVQDPACEWLDEFHRLIMEALILKISQGDAAWQAAFNTQRQSDTVLAHRALVRLTAPLASGAVRAGGVPTKDSLLTACHMLGAQLGIVFKRPAELHPGQATAHAVEAIARASRVRRRKVTLAGEWWNGDSGPLLATRKQDGSAVALLCQGIGAHYHLLDPADGSKTRVTAAVAASLNSAAYAFYKSLPLHAISVGALMSFIFDAIRADLLLVLLMGVLGGCLSLVFPIFTGIIFDSVIPGAERAQLWQLAGLMVVAAISSTLLTLVRSLATLRLEARTDIAAQAALWDRLLLLPAPFFRQFSSGDLAIRSLAMNQIRSILTNATLNSILSGVFSLFNLLLLFFYSWPLALLTLGLTSAFVGIAIFAGFLQLGHTRGVVQLRGRISSTLLQFINGIAKLRISGAESRAFAVWAHAFSDQKRLYLRSREITNRMTVLQSAFPIFAMQVLFLCASSQLATLSSSTLSTGAFLAFLAAFLQFVTCAVQFTSAIPSIVSIVPIFERAVPILQSLPEIQEGKSPPGELHGGLEVNHLSFRYEPGSPLVLRDVSFTVKPGEFVAITGPSGSGKSTLLRLLLGFEVPESGTVSYDDQDLTGLDVHALRQQLGVVLQSGRLVSGTILDNIIGALPLTHSDAWEAARMAGLDQDIKAMPMGLHTFVNDGGAGLSGGQRQRLMIARAVVNKPRILFFDEATSALDNRTQAIVSHSLQAMRTTRVVIAHRLSTIQKADRIFVFDDGAIVQSGSYEDLCAAPGLFRTLIQRQVL